MTDDALQKFRDRIHLFDDSPEIAYQLREIAGVLESWGKDGSAKRLAMRRITFWLREASDHIESLWNEIGPLATKVLDDSFEEEEDDER